MILKTLVELVVEVTTIKNKSVYARCRAFKTLLELYTKSKLSCDSSSIVRHKVEGFTVYAYDYYHLIFLYREIFLGQIYKCNSKNESLNIIDCGANIGLSVLYFKKLFPNSKIRAYEPDPIIFELLKKNVCENNLLNVEIHNCALTDKKGTAIFYLPKKKGALYGSFFQKYTQGEEIRLQTHKLSSFIENEHVDILKMDVEGSEISIIRDLYETGKLKRIRKMIMEYHVKLNDMDIDALYNSFFKENNFFYQRRRNKITESTTGDLLVEFYQH